MVAKHKYAEYIVTMIESTFTATLRGKQKLNNITEIALPPPDYCLKK